MPDFGLKKLQQTIKRLRFPSASPSTMKFLEKTKNDIGIHKSDEKSPEFGFSKIRRLLLQNPMDRIKYLNVKEHLKNLSLKDRFIHMISGRQMFGAGKGMMGQFKSLPENARVDDSLLFNIDPKKLWQELQYYAFHKWGLKHFGFTEIPQDIIIQGRHVLYRYALVFIDEMRKDRIDAAPHMKAGYETFRIYNHLGQAVIDIGKWLRKHGIRCQPNHPLGGLVSYVPLAGKAGLGWQGMNGLLITPEYGQRQRIAPIYLEKPFFPFTDSAEHSWIEKYCLSCRLCQKECPPDAIQENKTVYCEDVPTIGRLARCLDPIKCHPQFSKWDGCSICIKVCPFSQNKEFYDRMRVKLKRTA